MEHVIVISDTVQEFLGERFYLCGKYFQHHGKRLHRAVWEWHNGQIPEGYHVHHLDEDRSNNEIENLALLPGVDHIKQHMNTERAKANGHRAIEIARAAACEWHKSADGRAWHSEAAKKNWENAQPKTFTCNECGREFQTCAQQVKGNHFCSNKCKAAYRRNSGVDDIVKVCEVCGKPYTVNKYYRSTVCSKECARVRRWGK